MLPIRCGWKLPDTIRDLVVDGSLSAGQYPHALVTAEDPASLIDASSRKGSRCGRPRRWHRAYRAGT